MSALRVNPSQCAKIKEGDHRSHDWTGEQCSAEIFEEGVRDKNRAEFCGDLEGLARLSRGRCCSCAAASGWSRAYRTTSVICGIWVSGVRISDMIG